ncbi:helix-turn-helix domain-containing protein [Acidocella aromatica]|uniref:Transcriptional regulator with XRE-family HTH domain n=1 Tax=Acidocella aromatica TaxID=1303579 RepID=A0A840VCG7_9PROT|nr:XRE family transcriptional regulator [Acidocella aromatica]MBB5373354.1 transcriptional regulator with XRE-family HTH domain [Acidocella aromatica]
MTTKRKPKAATDAEAAIGSQKQADAPIAQRIGDVIRRHRKAHGLTLSQLAAGAGLSSANLSRIENGSVTSSFESLERICQAVGLSLADLFAEVSEPKGQARLVRAEEQMEVIRSGTSHGHMYKLIAYQRGPGRSFEGFYITMDKDSEVYPRFRHPGTELLYMLRGSMEYRYGSELYTIRAGDTFTFSAHVEHGPERLFSDEIHFICVMIYDT